MVKKVYFLRNKNMEMVGDLNKHQQGIEAKLHSMP